MTDDGAVYEMLWECAYCGTRGLLGKTHRFCPRCGAPQDPGRRYFPSDEEKVAVHDHVYVGADRTCRACGSAMSAKAVHCTQCGAPMEGASEVRRVDEAPAPTAAEAVQGETVPAEPVADTESPPRRRGRGCAVVLGIMGVLLLLLITALCWKKPAQAELVGHGWERSIAIEAFGPVRDSAWCDNMPSGAYGVSRTREVRRTEQIPNGEDCVTRRTDQGDGTFRERRECTPRYREKDIYDDRCSFSIDRWTTARTAAASGSGLSPAPAWPVVSLRTGTCRGCEREGGRRESYRVDFRTGEGRAFSCTFPEASWRSMAEGSRWNLDVGAITGLPFCGSLKPDSTSR
jgi:hypothetical protein